MDPPFPWRCPASPAQLHPVLSFLRVCLWKGADHGRLCLAHGFLLLRPWAPRPPASPALIGALTDESLVFALVLLYTAINCTSRETLHYMECSCRLAEGVGPCGIVVVFVVSSRSPLRDTCGLRLRSPSPVSQKVPGVSRRLLPCRGNGCASCWMIQCIPRSFFRRCKFV